MHKQLPKNFRKFFVYEIKLWHCYQSNKIIQRSVFCSILIFIYVSLFLLNHFTPMVNDDYLCSLSVSTTEHIEMDHMDSNPSEIYYDSEPECYSLNSISNLTLRRLETVNDVFNKLRFHYNNWDGRVPQLFFTFVFFLAGKTWFNILQPIIYIFLLLAICFHITGSFRIKNSLLFFVAIFSYLYAAAFGQAVLWMSGSFYFITTTIALYFLLPYRFASNRYYSRIQNILLYLTTFLGGIYVGWDGANLAVASLIMIGLFLVFYRFQKIPYRIWMFTGIVGVIIGLIIMYAAPGNISRASDGVLGFNTEVGFISFIIKKIKTLFYLTYDLQKGNIYILLLLNIALINVSVLFNYARNASKIFVCSQLIYFIGGLSAIYSLIASPFIAPLRATYSANILLIVAIFVPIYFFMSSLGKEKQKLIFYTNVFVFFVLFGCRYIQDISHLRSVAREWNQRTELLVDAKENNISNIRLPRLSSSVKLIPNNEISEDKNFWFNQSLAHYFGLDCVELEPISKGEEKR